MIATADNGVLFTAVLILVGVAALVFIVRRR